MFGTFLRQLMERHRPPVSANHLAERVGVSHVTVLRWLKGEGRPNAPRCGQIAAVFRVPVEDVLAAAGHPPSALHTMQPLAMEPIDPRSALDTLTDMVEDIFYLQPLEEASAGPAMWSTDPLPFSRRAMGGRRQVRGVIVRGNCMEPEILDGDLAFVDLDASPRPGDVVAARTVDGLVVKRLHRDSDRDWLEGNNGERVDGGFEIRGVVFSIQRSLLPHRIAG